MYTNREVKKTSRIEKNICEQINRVYRIRIIFFLLSFNHKMVLMNQPIAPVLSAHDSLTQAVGFNIVPNQEYLLQGSILDSAVETLLHRWVFLNFLLVLYILVGLSDSDWMHRGLLRFFNGRCEKVVTAFFVIWGQFHNFIA